MVPAAERASHLGGDQRRRASLVRLRVLGLFLFLSTEWHGALDFGLPVVSPGLCYPVPTDVAPGLDPAPFPFAVALQTNRGVPGSTLPQFCGWLDGSPWANNARAEGGASGTRRGALRMG